MKKQNPNPNEKEDKQSEIKDILLNTELLTPQQLKEKNKSKESEKIELTGGGFTSIKERKDIITSHKQPYKPHFAYNKTQFFKLIFQLNKWTGYKQFVKPKEVPSWINRLIYGRFATEILKHMKKENPILFTWIRKHKYFQYLTKEGQEMLDMIIKDFEDMTIGYDNWDKFEFDYCKKYALPMPQKIKF